MRSSNGIAPVILAAVAVVLIAPGRLCADVPYIPYSEETKAYPVGHQAPVQSRDLSLTTPAGIDRQGPLSAEGAKTPLAASGCYTVHCEQPAESPDWSSKARQLPPGPGAASLFLLGIGCLGTAKLGKSVRGSHCLPDWFHAGGPNRIGHVSVLNPLGWTLPAPGYDYDRPSDDDDRAHLTLRGMWRLVHPLEAQYFLTTAHVRGPPTPL